jgi:hypothetical protein
VSAFAGELAAAPAVRKFEERTTAMVRSGTADELSACVWSRQRSEVAGASVLRLLGDNLAAGVALERQ